MPSPKLNCIKIELLQLKYLFLAITFSIYSQLSHSIQPGDETNSEDAVADAAAAEAKAEVVAAKEKNARAKARTAKVKSTIKAVKEEVAKEAAADASVDRNEKYEKKLNKVFKENHSRPTNQDDWEFVQSHSGRKKYVSQRGDTLWGLSEMIFGDVNYWPKVWSLNKNIQDPHAVPPGTVITFEAGSTDVSSNVLLSTSISPYGVPEWIPPPEVRNQVLTYTLNAEIPDPPKISKPLLVDFPSSIPDWKMVPPNEIKMESKIDITARTAKSASPLKYLESYITEREFNPEGEIVGTELDMSTASEFQYVFVKMFNSKYKKYLVVKDGGEIKDHFTGRIGHVVEILGEVQISESVDPEKQIYRAIVTKNIGQVSKGAKLIFADLPVYHFDDNGAVGSVDARIIGGRFGVNRRIFGTDSIIYLNLGNSGGVSPGQILPIYEYQLGPTNSEIVKVNPRPIGKMKVVNTTPELATAVILESNREVQVGDGTSRNAAPPIVQEGDSGGSSSSSGEAPSSDNPSVDAPPMDSPPPSEVAPSSDNPPVDVPPMDSPPPSEAAPSLDNPPVDVPPMDSPPPSTNDLPSEF